MYDLKMSPPRDDNYLDFFAKELGYLNWLDYLDHDIDNVIEGWEPEDEEK